MKSSVEVLEDNKVKVYVEVEEAEFDKDIDKAFKLLAKEVNLPGFRAGKVPRKVLEARLGLGPAREQALRDAVPEYLSRAVNENDVDLIATPEVEITDGEESGPVEFEATCQIRPVITVSGYDALRVELPGVEVVQADILILKDLLAEKQAEAARLEAGGTMTSTGERSPAHPASSAPPRAPRARRSTMGAGSRSPARPPSRLSGLAELP